jgi:alpha-tubulin suppressor-like RCC1 family protein
LTDGGEIYIFGSSAFTKEEKNPKSKKKIEILRAPDEPFRVPFFTSKRRIMYVSAGPQHILAISRSRELFAWGNNRYGELGLLYSELTY